jgi:hypothetical protein
MRAANSNQAASSLPDINEINEYVKEYLRYSNYTNTLECLEAEFKSKQVSNKVIDILILRCSINNNRSNNQERIYLEYFSS